MNTNQVPWVWLPADHRNMANEDGNLPFLMLGHKYAYAMKRGADAQPVVFALADRDDIDTLIGQVDGVMLTGSPANVHPSAFGQDIADPSLPLDPLRDSLTLALVQACLARGVPLLGICRGFQEINVALGGSLYQQVHRVAGKNDHREDATLKVVDQYGFAHPVKIAADSAFAQWAGADHARVNSLHGQGIDRLASGLVPLVWAHDGLVEGYQVKNAKSFAFAMQWHPEWRFWETPFYGNVFKAFGDACRSYRATRLM